MVESEDFGTFPMANKFELVSPYKPNGSQPEAIKELTEGLREGRKHQVLLGVTGSGKTFTMANIVAQIQKPTLVLAHNKTLAAQLCSEFRDFFPNNAVNYFVSYYDYYQPEAYLPVSDTYIEKDSSINEEIDKLRHRATRDLLTRKDVLIVASVSCIYGLGSVEEYEKVTVKVKRGEKRERNILLRQLTEIQYYRNDIAFKRGTFRVRGDVVEILPSYSDTAFRIEFFGDEVERITETDSLTGELFDEIEELKIFPAKHTVTTKEKIEDAIVGIEAELALRLADLRKQNKLVEVQRLEQRTKYDIEMLRETGYVSGIENYTRYFNHAKPGDRPGTLFNFFPKDFLLFVDESHMTIPQVRGMFNGNFMRKQTLVNYGFRLPSSHDNRPLNFEEFEQSVNQAIYVSATPGPYELVKAEGLVVEQIVRPTGLIDPEVEVRPTANQIDNLLHEIRERINNGDRALVTTLTKRMAEDLSEYFTEAGIKVRYLHSDIDTFERIDILRDLRLGKIDVIVGINLLREGLDLPEVSLVAILDADKEGFLRSEMALIQTIGRASRNLNGHVIMYADRITDSMRRALDETNRRREIQTQYNKDHGITPQSIIKAVKDIGVQKEDKGPRIDIKKIPKEEMKQVIDMLEIEMDRAAANMEFEKAADLRDQIEELKAKLPR